MKQKKIGIIATISAMIQGFLKSKDYQNDIIDLSRKRDALLTNNHSAPIPLKFKNQRQKRKLARQTNKY